ncbi:hypothetical protein HDU79_006327 [Rhizoclosmatium sp. JEL0117]|nr:hypothetical protein HDU79_006327 [Rhizoclosmatium sp. JEL0117]
MLLFFIPAGGTGTYQDYHPLKQKQIKLQDLAVDWTERACNRLEEIGDNGKNNIQRGWNNIYLDKALDPDFIVAACFQKAKRAAKQAAELKEKEEAAQAAVLIFAFTAVMVAVDRGFLNYGAVETLT